MTPHPRWLRTEPFPPLRGATPDPMTLHQFGADPCKNEQVCCRGETRLRWFERAGSILRLMPDDRCDRDALARFEYQASLLRQIARGERVNEVDWDHVIEDVGLSELHAVESYIELILVHLLKITTSPDSDAVNHCGAELVSYQSNALRRFDTSMRQRIDAASAYRSAVQVTLLNGGVRPDWWPAEYPFATELLLNDECVALEQRLSAPPAPAVN